MVEVTSLTALEARSFFLKETSYVNFDLPFYFQFQDLLNALDKELGGQELSNCRSASPRDFEGVNYKLLSNKDGKYAWRPFQLINPAIYVSLVHTITNEINWKLIQARFNEFRKDRNIECHSIPMVSLTKDKSDTDSQIFNWWQNIEQKSLELSLDYRYLLQTDITDCYGSIYTHSISWAVHSKPVSKDKKNRRNTDFVGVAIDHHLQDMSYGQTNGIPQGSTLMDFIAELVLGYVDECLSKRIQKLKFSDFRILRYRDDYRIFTNNPFGADEITKELSEILSSIGLKLNASKTVSSQNVIRDSIKPDKRYWIANERKTKNKQEWLIQMFMLAEQFPNSGTLAKEMKKFLLHLESDRKKDRNLNQIISVLVEIAYRNPRVCPTVISSLSLLINQIEESQDKEIILGRIRTKFSRLPNSGFLKIWLQRFFLKTPLDQQYDENLCRKVVEPEIELWKFDWISSKSILKIVRETPIVNYQEISALNTVVSKNEISWLIETSPYDYEME